MRSNFTNLPIFLPSPALKSPNPQFLHIKFILHHFSSPAFMQILDTIFTEAAISNCICKPPRVYSISFSDLRSPDCDSLLRGRASEHRRSPADSSVHLPHERGGIGGGGPAVAVFGRRVEYPKVEDLVDRHYSKCHIIFEKVHILHNFTLTLFMNSVYSFLEHF